MPVPKPSDIDLDCALNLLRDDIADRRAAAARHQRAGHELDASEVHEFADRLQRVFDWLADVE